MIRTLVLLTLLASAAGTAAAQIPPASGEALSVHPEAKGAIDKLLSPYCPGMMLEVCTSSGGAMLRDSIQRMAEAGLASESIVELIVADYGEQWRAEPQRSGAGMYAWLLPPAAIVVGLSAVGIVLSRRRREKPERDGDEEVTPEEEQRLREALKELDEAEEPVF
jgi:cytochrome c-type biogenesis protein CcmH